MIEKEAAGGGREGEGGDEVRSPTSGGMCVGAGDDTP